MVKSDPENDEISKVRVRYIDGKMCGYTIVTKKYPDGHENHAFVPIQWYKKCLESGVTEGYVKLLNEYLKKHPEEAKNDLVI